MKRIQLTHGSARVEDDCSPETIKALDELSKVAYNHNFKTKTMTDEERAKEWENYIQLKKGDRIKEGDEVMTDSKFGWHTPHPDTIGTLAPDPQYTAHRLYRRPKRNL